MTGEGKPSPRLHLPRVEKKRKRVFLENWQDHAGVKKDERLLDQLLTILERIESGQGIPEWNYRNGIDSTPDELLAEHGIMHIHLDHAGSDYLIYLVQYPDRVVFLESNNHKHFRTKPVGQLLLSGHEPKLKKIEADLPDATADEGAVTVKNVSTQDEEQKERIRRSVENLKRQTMTGTRQRRS